MNNGSTIHARWETLYPRSALSGIPRRATRQALVPADDDEDSDFVTGGGPSVTIGPHLSIAAQVKQRDSLERRPSQFMPVFLKTQAFR
jgi:hypothetical protein